MLFIIISYWPPPPPAKKGLELLCSGEDVVRAWPGGTGSAKISGNYGYVTEAGSSNFFAIWRTEDGKLQLVTAPLTEHTILAGVTRKSVLELTETRLDQAGSSQLDIEPLEGSRGKFNHLRSCQGFGSLVQTTSNNHFLHRKRIGSAPLNRLHPRFLFLFGISSYFSSLAFCHLPAGLKYGRPYEGS